MTGIKAWIRSRFYYAPIRVWQVNSREWINIYTLNTATLAANHLKAVEKIADISARLIVNQAAL